MVLMQNCVKNVFDTNDKTQMEFLGYIYISSLKHEQRLQYHLLK